MDGMFFKMYNDYKNFISFTICIMSTKVYRHIDDSWHCYLIIEIGHEYIIDYSYMP